MNIFIPFIGMITLTLAVWIVMYAKRLVWISKHDIDPNSIATPETLSATIPDQVNHASNNFKNLFELPVLFYALCLYLIAQEKLTISIFTLHMHSLYFAVFTVSFSALLIIFQRDFHCIYFHL